ncbi:MAG: NUDIX domain-containing protein [Gammaproteobacteria bacterium]|nr:MAG: NUDIX domain-containing protein [Gammaproteobacteria bacterium]UCH41501.1 MAG: NUDIX domain-containing protein [Gammaproteobacteria bacterium]
MAIRNDSSARQQTQFDFPINTVRLGDNLPDLERLVSVSHELLDVVDADDNVIAVKTRGEIHARGLMHRAVHILVFNSRGELFLQKRSMSKDEQPGKWDSSAAGHVDSGEDYLSCARREIEEELGIVADQPFERLFKLPATSLTGNEHCLVYRYHCDGPMVLHPHEIDDGQWVSPAEMDRRIDADDQSLTEAVVLIWKNYRELHPETA